MLKYRNYINLKKLKQKEGKIVIIQSRNYIFFYEYTKKSDNSQIYKCSFYRDKLHPCKAYVILNQAQQFDQKDFNLEHSAHDIKSAQIKTLYENKEIINIINKNPNYFCLTVPKLKILCLQKSI